MASNVESVSMSWPDGESVLCFCLHVMYLCSRKHKRLPDIISPLPTPWSDRWWCDDIKTFSVLLVLYWRNQPVPGGFPSPKTEINKRKIKTVMWSFYVSFVVSLSQNKLLNIWLNLVNFPFDWMYITASEFGQTFQSRVVHGLLTNDEW